jgi:hypothetical protein
MVLMRIACSECSDSTAAAYLLRPKWEEILFAIDVVVTTTGLISTQLRTELATSTYDVTLKAATVVGQLLYIHIPECRHECSQLRSSQLMQATFKAPVHLPQFLPWTTLMTVLHYQYTRQTCSAPDCTRTPEQHGRPFRSCTGCWWVQYCSRKCQKNTWRRSDELQHRDVCPLSSLPLPKYELRVAVKSIPVHLSDEEGLVVGAINAHFSALTMHKITH